MIGPKHGQWEEDICFALPILRDMSSFCKNLTCSSYASVTPLAFSEVVFTTTVGLKVAVGVVGTTGEIIMPSSTKTLGGGDAMLSFSTQNVIYQIQLVVDVFYVSI